MNAGALIRDRQLQVIRERLDDTQRLTKFMCKFFEVSGMNIQEIRLSRGSLLPGNSERRHIVHSEFGALSVALGSCRGSPFNRSIVLSIETIVKSSDKQIFRASGTMREMSFPVLRYVILWS